MRLKKLEAWVKKKGLDLLLIDDPTDLLYLTSLFLSTGRLAVFPDRSILFVDGRYIEKAKKSAPCKAVLKAELGDVFKAIKTVGFDSSYMSVDAFSCLEKLYPHVTWVFLPKPCKSLRMVKEPQEIAALKKSAQLTWQGYQHLLGLVKEGVSEKELALAFEIYCRQRGASRLSFEPIVAFGENSAYPHHRAGETRLKQDQFILFDLGAAVDGYAGDMTRGFFFGAPHPQLQSDYELVQTAARMAREQIRPGVPFGQLDITARSFLRQKGVDSLFTHSLSHGVGLDVHEFPSLKEGESDADLPLQEGMVFTVEPGLYRPGIGGVRYEDTVIVTKSGHENLYPTSHAQF